MSLANNPYLKLLRIPNIFTVPPDIILGFLIAQISVYNSSQLSLSYNSFVDLIILVISSVSLYLGGLVSNDLFDVKIDRIERPGRPLSSGRVQKKHAIILLIIFFGLGFSLSLLISVVTVEISALLIILILLYNYKLKAGFSRPFVMGAIRALNIFYGFSWLFSLSTHSINSVNTGLQNLFISTNADSILLLSLVLVSVFFHIFVLTMISSKETPKEFTNKEKKISSVKTIYCIYIFFLFLVGFTGFYLVINPIVYAFFILVLGINVSVIFYKAHKQMLKLNGNLAMQFLVKNMLVLLILLDSTFIAAIAGPLAGVLTAFLILPCVFLAKKISMT